MTQPAVKAIYDGPRRGRRKTPDGGHDFLAQTCRTYLIPRTMTNIDDPHPVIDYATARPDQTSPVALRRLAVLNGVAGVLMLLVLPGFFFAGYLMLRNDPSLPGVVRPVTIASTWAAVRPNLPRLAPQIAYLLASAAAALASAVLIGRRRGRTFSIIAAFIMCLCIPIGTAAGLPTAIILMRRRTAATYAANR